MKVLDLFSGIGGFSLGLERAGFKTVAFCEIEPYCQKVLKKHWPDVPIYEDVRNVTAERLGADGIFPDVITGGFPCQDISLAGRQAGIEAERSGLWSELVRIIGDIRPKYAIVENVTALISGDRGRWFGRVLGDLAEIGYDAEWHCIPASELGAHHHRDRVWIICYPNCSGQSVESINDETSIMPSNLLPNPLCRRERNSETIDKPSLDEERNTSAQGQRRVPVTSKARRNDNVAHPVSNRLQRGAYASKGKQTRREIITRCQITRAYCKNGTKGGFWYAEPNVGRVANGVPRRVDRLRGLGNAVVPQIPEFIGRAIMEWENATH